MYTYSNSKGNTHNSYRNQTGHLPVRYSQGLLAGFELSHIVFDETESVTLGGFAKNQQGNDSTFTNLFCGFSQLAEILASREEQVEKLRDMLVDLIHQHTQGTQVLDVFGLLGSYISLDHVELLVHPPAYDHQNENPNRAPGFVLERVVQGKDFAGYEPVVEKIDPFVPTLEKIYHLFVRYDNLVAQGLSKEKARSLTGLENETFFELARMIAQTARF